jgi:hypothetical protein
MTLPRCLSAVALAAALVASGCHDDCDAVEEQARALVDELAACNPGDTCQVIQLADLAGDDNCTAAFQCSAAVHPTAGFDSFRERAQKLAKDKRSCGRCVMAACVDPGLLQSMCNPRTRRCELINTATPDGGA